MISHMEGSRAVKKDRIDTSQFRSEKISSAVLFMRCFNTVRKAENWLPEMNRDDVGESS